MQGLFKVEKSKVQKLKSGKRNREDGERRRETGDWHCKSGKAKSLKLFEWTKRAPKMLKMANSGERLQRGGEWIGERANAWKR